MRHSWWTCLMLPLHLHGWKSGSVGVASERQIRHVSPAAVEDVSRRTGAGGRGLMSLMVSAGAGSCGGIVEPTISASAGSPSAMLMDLQREGRQGVGMSR